MSITSKTEAAAQAADQAAYRERVNPKWKERLREHYRVLHLEGPAKMGAKEIIKRAQILEGFKPKKGRRTLL